MQLNVNTAVRREYPTWNTRAKIRKVDDQGNVLPNEYSFGGEAVRVSPRFIKGGTNYRVRPERPAVFFAAFCFECGMLPSALTPEEAQSDAGLEILEPLWEANKHLFTKLESPYAACDQSTEPSLKVGFSFNILQILVEQIGSVRSSANKPTFRPAVNGSTLSPVTTDLIRQKIEAMRSRAGTKPEVPTPSKKK